MTRWVVGVDGSSHARAAAQWAAGVARAGDELVLVHVWDYPAVLGIEPALMDGDQLADEAGELLTREVERVALPEGGPRVRTEVRQGDAVRELLQVADGDGVVVVGSRGLGGVMGALLGSVSHAVIHDAECPVVVIPRRAVEATTAADGG